MKRLELITEPVEDKLTTEMLKLMAAKRNYLDDPSNPEAWSVTEFMQLNNRATIAGRNILAGKKMDGATMLQDGAYRGPERIRLQVLSRQACAADKDGNPINHERKLFAVDFYDETKPSEDTAPVQGDFVLLKTSAREVDDAGNPMTGQSIMEFEAYHSDEKYIWREGMRNHYAEYEVDEFGCINVRPNHAMDLLRRYGERVAFPRWQQYNVPSEVIGKARRKITNWRFREIKPDEKIEPLKKQTKKQPVENAGTLIQ